MSSFTLESDSIALAPKAEPAPLFDFWNVSAAALKLDKDARGAVLDGASCVLITYDLGKLMSFRSATTLVRFI